jgi:hypothetical protein
LSIPRGNNTGDEVTESDLGNDSNGEEKLRIRCHMARIRQRAYYYELNYCY